MSAGAYSDGYGEGYKEGKADVIIELRSLLQQAHDALEANDIDPELTRQIATRLKQKDF